MNHRDNDGKMRPPVHRKVGPAEQLPEGPACGAAAPLALSDVAPAGCTKPRGHRGAHGIVSQLRVTWRDATD